MPSYDDRDYDDDSDSGSHSRSSGYDYGRDHSSHDSSSSSHAPAKGYEKTIEENRKSLANIQLEVDKDTGKANLFGFQVPQEQVAFYRAGLDQLKSVLLRNGESFYKTALGLGKAVGLKGQALTGAAAAVDTVARWGIIGAEQWSNVARASSDWAKKRKDLYAGFHPIEEATGANAGNNEVVRLAYARARNTYGAALKDTGIDAIRIAPLIFQGVIEQKKAMGRYDEQFKEFHTDLADKALTPAQQAAKRVADTMEKVAEERKNLEIIAQEREKFINDEMDKLQKDRKRTGGQESYRTYQDKRKKSNSQWEDQYSFWGKAKKDYGDVFDKEIKPEMLKSLRPEEKKKTEEHTAKNGQKNESFGGIEVNWHSLLSNFIADVIRKKGRKKDGEPAHVPEMIDHLRHEVMTQCDASSRDEYGHCADPRKADDITVSPMGREGGSVSLKAYILQMFQQHERDREPGIEWVKHDKKGNVVEVIDPLGPALAAKLKPTIDIIADAIADGLDPAAMVNLIGDNKIIIHGKGGAKTFAKPDAVRDVIDDLIPVMGSREVVKMEEFLGKFEKPEEIKNIIKGNLENKEKNETMKGEVRNLFATLFPDDILIQAGMKRRFINAARKQAHDHIYDFVAANVLYLAKKDEEGLKKLGMAEGEIKALHELAEKIDAGDEHALKAAVDGADKTVLDAVRTAGLLEQHHGTEGTKYWTDRAAEMPEVHKKFAKAANENEENKEGKSDRKGSRAGADEDSQRGEHSKKERSRRGYGDDEDDSHSHASRVSKKSNGRHHDEDDSFSESSSSKDHRGDEGFSNAFAGKKGGRFGDDESRPAAHTERVRRDADRDEERYIS